MTYDRPSEFPTVRRTLLIRAWRVVALGLLTVAAFWLIYQADRPVHLVEHVWQLVLSLFLGFVVLTAATPALRRLLRIKWRQFFW